MEIKDWITIVALILGPILGIQIQKISERKKEKKDRKLNIFKTLMATRGARLSFEHVRALNMIDTEFYDVEKVIITWKQYLDCLGTNCENDAQFAVWSSNRDQLFVNVLKEMANNLNYHFDDVHLKKAIYIPRAHGEEEEDQRWFKEQFKEIVSGKKPLAVQLKKAEKVT